MRNGLSSWFDPVFILSLTPGLMSGVACWIKSEARAPEASIKTIPEKVKQ